MLATAIPSLPPPPLLEQAVTNPWPIVALLVLAAIVSFFAFNSRGRAMRGLAVAGVLLALGVGTSVLAFLVVTDREVMRARSAALTAAVAEGDGATVRTIVHPTTEVRGSMADGWGLDRIVSFVSALPSTYAVSDHQIRRIEAAKDGPNVGRTHVHVRVLSERVGTPLPVVVRLDWQLIDGEWWVVQIEPLSIPGANLR